MNKTVTINLGKINFYVDEGAYEKLDKYLKAISASLDAQSRAETMADIEARIAELFLEERKNKDRVIGVEEVDHIIEVMGQPEDYQMDEEKTDQKTEQQEQESSAKKLYRDIEHNAVGGVCAGLGHYFGISKIWIRLAFLLLWIPDIISGALVPSGSTVFLIYVVMWIVVPAARTTAQKLEMQGKSIDIGNIEQKVREEFTKAKETVKNTDYSGLNRLVEGLGEILKILLRAFVIFIGVILVLAAGSSLIGIVVSLLFFGGFSGITFFGLSIGAISTLPTWFTVILLLLITGIPLFLLLLAGLRIISPRVKGISLTGILVLVGVWVLAFIPIVMYTPNWTNIDLNFGKIHGQGPVIEESYPLTKDFDKLEIKEAWNANLIQSDSTYLVVRSQENILSEFDYNITDNKLSIGTKGNRISTGNIKAMEVDVYYKDLSDLNAQSVSSITSKDTLEQSKLKLSASSAGTINLKVTTDTTLAKTSSASTITLAGFSGYLSGKASSGAKVHAKELKTKKTKARASSGGTVQVFASDTLNAKSSSGGSIYYYGNPKNKEVKKSSSGGSIKKR